MSQMQFSVDLKALLEAGVHFGHQSRRWNPKMAEYIYADRDGVHIFDLVKTASQLEQAMQFAYELGKNGKNMVFVGTKRQAQEVVKEAAALADAMYITTRWLGGFLTNWEQVSKSIDKMNTMKKGLAEGKYDHYTKYERMQMQKDIERLERFFIGVADLKTQPDAFFMVDVNEEEVATREAATVGVPIIAIVDSNSNPDRVDYVSPGNDDAVSSVTLLTTMVAQAYADGKKHKAEAK
jgi:small subunit ribosomal protein S2